MASPKMNSTNRFDQRAQGWDADPVKVARAQAVADAIREDNSLSPAMHALEYGCGTGLLSFALADRLGHITLADSSAGMLEVLAEKLAAEPKPNMRLLKLDLATDPPPSERYDLICSLMTFHHIADIDGILGKLYALLTTPGYLCVADLDAEDGSFHGAGFDGHKGFDRNDIGARAVRARFRDISFRTVFRMTKDDTAGQKEFPLFLMVARK